MCKDFIRKNRKRQGDLSLNAKIGENSETQRGDTLPSNSRNPEETARSNEDVKNIQIAIHALPHKLKFPFIFCILEDNSYDACAEVLKTSRKTVETRIYRARKLLRAELSELVQADE